VLLAATISSVLLAMTLAMAAPTPTISLAVDTSKVGPMPARQLKAMQREAEAIWQSYGVAIEWIDGERPLVGDLERPTDSIRIVRDVTAGPGTSAGRMLGAVLFLEGRAAAEKTVTISVETVQRLVGNTRWANRRIAEWPPSVRHDLVGRALGRVLAHEIGHYLLVWRGHSPDGLMQTSFRGEALVGFDRGGFMLAQHLMPRLRSRMAQLVPPGSAIADAEGVKDQTER
jgi:hypothetical protein